MYNTLPPLLERIKELLVEDGVAPDNMVIGVATGDPATYFLYLHPPLMTGLLAGLYKDKAERAVKSARQQFVDTELPFEDYEIIIRVMPKPYPATA